MIFFSVHILIQVYCSKDAKYKKSLKFIQTLEINILKQVNNLFNFSSNCEQLFFQTLKIMTFRGILYIIMKIFALFLYINAYKIFSDDTLLHEITPKIKNERIHQILESCFIIK